MANLKQPTEDHERRFEVVFSPEEHAKEDQLLTPVRKKKVAAYARVSTELDAQQSSYEAQINYYTGYIKSKPEWEFVDVYSDEGISGTNYKNRDGFNRMIVDAKAGKIELILTKSISRFARNTVDSLTITRDLKKHGVEVFFEKENISSMDPRAELIFTILSSVAQEESRSISENVTWGHQRRMEAGKVSLAWSHFLGYEKGPNGLPQIVEEEAKVVRDIYQWCLDGLTVTEIADRLTSLGIKTPGGKNVWRPSTVRSILTNEKYKGDARLAKTYTVDFLTKEVRVNKGERKQLYIHDSHDAIIDPETFELVQKELARRNRRGKRSDSPFCGKLICGCCGAYYGRKVWHSDREKKKYVWRCYKKYDHEVPCPTPKLEDPEIISAYLIAVNKLLQTYGKCCVEYKERFLSMISDNSELKAKLIDLKAEKQDKIKQLEHLVMTNATQAQDQSVYQKEYNNLCRKIEDIKSTIAVLEKELASNLTRREEVKLFLDTLRDNLTGVKEFDIEQWHHIVEDVLVMPDKTLVFRFRNGEKVRVDLSEIPPKQ